MEMSRWINNLFRNIRIDYIVAFAMILLAYLTLAVPPSLSVLQFEKYGLEPWMQSVLFLLGAVFCLHSRGRDWQFYIATLPLVGHIGMSLYIVYSRRGGYQQGAIYLLTILLIYLLYARQESENE